MFAFLLIIILKKYASYYHRYFYVSMLFVPKIRYIAPIEIKSWITIPITENEATLSTGILMKTYTAVLALQ